MRTIDLGTIDTSTELLLLGGGNEIILIDMNLSWELASLYASARTSPLVRPTTVPYCADEYSAAADIGMADVRATE